MVHILGVVVSTVCITVVVWIRLLVDMETVLGIIGASGESLHSPFNRHGAIYLLNRSNSKVMVQQTDEHHQLFF